MNAPWQDSPRDAPGTGWEPDPSGRFTFRRSSEDRPGPAVVDCFMDPHADVVGDGAYRVRTDGWAVGLAEGSLVITAASTVVGLPARAVRRRRIVDSGDGCRLLLTAELGAHSCGVGHAAVASSWIELDLYAVDALRRSLSVLCDRIGNAPRLRKPDPVIIGTDPRQWPADPRVLHRRRAIDPGGRWSGWVADVTHDPWTDGSGDAPTLRTPRVAVRETDGELVVVGVCGGRLRWPKPEQVRLVRSESPSGAPHLELHGRLGSASGPVASEVRVRADVPSSAESALDLLVRRHSEPDEADTTHPAVATPAPAHRPVRHVPDTRGRTIPPLPQIAALHAPPAGDWVVFSPLPSADGPAMPDDPDLHADA